MNVEFKILPNATGFGPTSNFNFDSDMFKIVEHRLIVFVTIR